MADDCPSGSDLEPREPTVEDLLDLCSQLNCRGARYVMVGGFALRAAGYSRQIIEADLLLAADPENEGKVYDALSMLPDSAARKPKSCELQQYAAIRVADEIVVDLMRMAGGIDYDEAAKDMVIRETEDVPIPFASPRLL